jgi:hypothetical protein
MMFPLARRIASGLLLLFSEKVQIGIFMLKEGGPDLEFSWPGSSPSA